MDPKSEDDIKWDPIVRRMLEEVANRDYLFTIRLIWGLKTKRWYFTKDGNVGVWTIKSKRRKHKVGYDYLEYTVKRLFGRFSVWCGGGWIHKECQTESELKELLKFALERLGPVGTSYNLPGGGRDAHTIGLEEAKERWPNPRPPDTFEEWK